MTLSNAELAIHRRGTEAFIAADATTIVLIPHQEQTSGGTKKFIAQTPRSPQDFKVIWGGDTGIVRRTPNGVRSFDFIIVGKYDAEVAVNDQYENGQFVVEYVFPPNGYEQKAGGVAHGQF